MALPNCMAVYELGTGTEPIRGGITLRNGAMEGEAEVTLVVEFDGPGSTFNQVLFASAGGMNFVPPLGFSLPPYRCTGLHPTRISGTKWKVRVVYSLPAPWNEPPPDTLDEETGSRWAIEINSTRVAVEVPIQRDIDGNPMLNSAADPVTKTGTIYDEEIAISFCTNVVDYTAIDDAMAALDTGGEGGAINSDTVNLVIRGQTRSFDPHKLRFMGASLSTVLGVNRTDNQPFTRCVYNVRHRASNWLWKPANMGCYGASSLDGFTSNLVRFPLVDGQGNFLTTPVPLKTTMDGTGAVTYATRAEAGDAMEILPQGVSTAVNGLGFRTFKLLEFTTELLWGIATP